MDEEFLTHLYEATQQFENWRHQSEHETFDEAESAYFDVVDEAKDRGMNYIGRGGDRDVYSGGSISGNDTVIKIARESLSQNQRAIETWKEMSDEAKEHVATITDWSDGYEWMIQVRASGRGDITEVGRNLSEHDLHVSDLNGENVAQYEGQSVLIDLGQIH